MLGVLLISSIAGVIIHIPAGIGVLESVYLALLSRQHASHCTIIAALLAYRVLYLYFAAGALSGAGEPREAFTSEERAETTEEFLVQKRYSILTKDGASLVSGGCPKYAAASGIG